MGKKATGTYDDSSIGLNQGASRIRNRPASILGSASRDGARQGFIEIYGNALDEATSGFGDRLDIKYYKDWSLSVRDTGRGVPLGWNDSKKVATPTWNWHIIYNELYGGGKLDDEEKQRLLRDVKDWLKFKMQDIPYITSIGLNGVGAAATQYTSEFFEVKSYRDGVCTTCKFERGMPCIKGKLVDMSKLSQDKIEKLPEFKAKTKESNGTYVHWKPDATVFASIDIGSDWLLDTCKHIAGTSSLDVYFEDENTGETYEFKGHTLEDIARERCNGHLVELEEESDFPALFETEQVIEHGSSVIKGKEQLWLSVCQLAVGVTDGTQPSNHLCFHNGVCMVLGAQYTSIDSAIALFFSDKSKDKSLKLKTVDFEGVFNVVVSSYSFPASLKNQTKDSVDDEFVLKLLEKTLYHELEKEYSKGNKVVLDAIDRVIAAAELRITVKKQTKLLKEAGPKKRREREPEKFASCDAYERKDYANTELWIAEGDSAAGALKTARNKNFQAILPIRGKGLNVAKASASKIVGNAEIKDLFAVLGTGFDLKAKGTKSAFDISKLRFDKIIFATDADDDGFHIRTLLFSIFYYLAPQILLDGHVYIAETPRFRIEFKGKKEPIYAYDDIERDAILDSLDRSTVKNIARYKGLGEINANILRETTVCPDGRKLIPLTCDYANPIEVDIIDALLGKDQYDQRRQLVINGLGGDAVESEAEYKNAIKEVESMHLTSGKTYVDL